MNKNLPNVIGIFEFNAPMIVAYKIPTGGIVALLGSLIVT